MGAAHEPLAAGDGDGLDADAGVGADFLAHFLCQKFDDFLGLGGALAPLDAGVNVLRVLPEDDEAHVLGMLDGGRDSRGVAHGAHAGVEIEDLPEGDVQAADAAAHRSRERPFDGHAKLFDGLDRVLRHPFLEHLEGLFAGEDFIPRDLTLAAVGFLDGRVKDPARGFPDVPARAVALDKRNDGAVGNDVVAVAELNALPGPREWDGY